jgi:ribosomal protein L39E
MSTVRDPKKKAVIVKVRKEGRRMPVWVTLKTKRRVRRNVKQRNWRRSKTVGKMLKRK